MAPHETPSSPPTGSAAGPKPGPDGTIRLTPESVRVLAHPMRSRLLGRLRRDGRATATELAAILGTNTGATSYHLRKLESVGLVVDTGEGDGRRRVWAPASETHSWYASDFEGDEDAETALNWLERDYIRHFAQQAERWLDRSHSWPLDWQDVTGTSDLSIVVTAEQLRALREEVLAVVERYRRVGQGNPEAKRVAVYEFALPLDVERAPRS